MAALSGSTSRPGIAVIDVDHTGASTLQLCAKQFKRFAAAQRAEVARTLLDYAASAGSDLIVLTRHTDGRTRMHKIHTNGTATTLIAPATTIQPTGTNRAGPGRRTMPRAPQPIYQAVFRLRSGVTGSWTIARQWLARHGLWLMLCAQILLLTGSLTYIALALYLWPSP